MDKIVALAKSRGFVYPGSEIYGGLANTWDYGNLGVELKNNVKKAWWKKFVQENPYNVGVDCAILMNPQTWVASGHLGGFSDPLMDCKECHERFRADKLIEDFCEEKGIELEGSVDGWSQEEMTAFIEEHQIPCPTCGKHNFTDIRQFNLMFKTFQGVTEDAKNTVYLRPETAQGIFVNFKNVQRTSRKKLPFGIAQIGKSFRNEITPGNFTFRTREFEQMELEFFCKPDTDLEWFDYWKNFCLNWLSELGLKEDEVRYRDHDAEELSFYSKATTDVEFLFPFGWGELWGIADRTDYDWDHATNVDTGDQIALAPEEGDTDAQTALDAFHEDNNCYTIEDVEGNTVTDPQGILYMTANSASGSKYYELLSTQQDYVAARSQNWLPSYSVITMTADSFSIDTYQITDDGKAEAIDDTFTIQKSGTDTSADTTDAAETESDDSAN